MNKKDDVWDGVSFEDWMVRMLKEGFPEIVVMYLKTLPEEKKKKYREIWRQAYDELRKKNQEVWEQESGTRRI